MSTKIKNLSRLFVGAFVTLSVVGCNQQQQMAPPVGEYAMMSVVKDDCSLAKSVSATIRGRQDINILPQVGGTLTKLCVKEGDRVKKGDVMFVIDQVPYIAAVKSAEAAVATAKASLATAQLTYESKVKLYEANVVSEFDLTTALNSKMVAESQLAETEAQLVNAENNLTYTTVTSPADGVIGVLPYRVGALVSSAIAEPLTTVSDNSVMEVYFSITEGELLSMIRKSGSREKALANFPEVSLRLSDGSMYDKVGVVKSMSGVIDRSTGTITVRADFCNPDGLLHSGATGNVVIPTSREDVILIPQSATFEIQDKKYVYTIEEGKTKSIMITTTNVTGGKDYIVETGLEPGAKIIVEGVGLLREGTPVKEKGAAAPAPAATTPAPAAE